MYYDRQGRPIDAAAWRAFVSSRIYASVAADKIGATLVSTVWLGLDHNFSGHGPPLIFETMVFDGPLGGQMRRYSTEDAARAGHAAMVDRVRGRAAARPN